MIDALHNPEGDSDTDGDNGNTDSDGDDSGSGSEGEEEDEEVENEGEDNGSTDSAARTVIVKADSGKHAFLHTVSYITDQVWPGQNRYRYSM